MLYYLFFDETKSIELLVGRISAKSLTEFSRTLEPVREGKGKTKKR